MIVAKLEDLSAQAPASKNLTAALRYLETARSQNLADGRYEVDGETVYALAQSYTTLPADDSAKYEAHRRYIDIQYIVEGCEAMGYAPLDKMTVTKEYNPDKDVVNGACPLAQSTLVKVFAGEAAVFFPSDAHAPKLAVNEPAAVKKIVLKVKID